MSLWLLDVRRYSSTMRFFSARLNFDNGIVLKFDGFLVNLFQYKTVSLLIFGWFSGVKAYSFRPSQAFTTRVNALLPLWTLWNQSLHTRNRCKSAENEHCVNGWILFSGNKIRIYTRVKRAFTKQISIFSAWWFRFVCPAAHGVKYASQVADYFAQVLE